MSDDLKPCPFCGGGAYQKTRWDEDIWSHDIVLWTQVGCQECDFFFEGPPGIEPTAAEHWNTRATAGEGMREGLKNAECGMTINEVLANYRAIRRAALAKEEGK